MLKKRKTTNMIMVSNTISNAILKNIIVRTAIQQENHWVS